MFNNCRYRVPPISKDSYKNQNMEQANETVGTAKQLVSFGEAVAAMKQGKRVQRKGWNGKGMFIFEQVPSSVDISIVPKMTSLPQAVKDEFLRRHEEWQNTKNTELKNFRRHAVSIQYQNQIAMVYPDNNIYGWVASPSDVLENDWIILD